MSIFGRAHGMVGGRGGSTLRTVVSRNVTAGINLPEPISSSSSSVTSPRSNNHNKSHAVYAGDLHASPNFSVAKSGNSVWADDENDWVSVNESEFGHGFLHDGFSFGPVPSLDEVQTAVSALKESFEPEDYSHSQFVRDKFGYNLNKDVTSPTALGYSASNELDIDWQESLLPPLSNRKLSQSSGRERVYEAFQMLQNEPHVQRMVISLSSDEAIWDRVQNNKVVREIRELFHAAEDSKSESSDESGTSNVDSNPTMNFISWMFDNTKAKVTEMFETISNLVNELFKLPKDEKATNGATAKESFDEKLRTSFMLTIMVLLVVVVTRAHIA